MMGCLRVPQVLLWVAFFCALLSYKISLADTAVADEDSPHTVSIVLLGRKGSGITSTVRQLLGSKASIHSADVAVASTDILEYTLRIPCSTGKDFNYLKLVDVPGLELGDNLEQDAEILSTLKSYLHDKGLPCFFLVVSRFDEKNFSEENSNFRQLLKRLEFLERSLFQVTTDNTVFLLTRLLNEPEDVQKSPEGRIEEFRKTILEHTTLPSPIEILVGDNKPDNETVQIEKGFFKFLNNELYPKNVLDKLVEVAERSVSSTDDKHTLQDVVKTLTETRETTEYTVQELVAHPTDEDIFENDLEAFEYLLRQDNLDLPSNEIQSILQMTYNKQDATTQINSCVQLMALRVALRNLNLVGSIDKLPQTLADQVTFFQRDSEGVMTSKYALFYLRNALALSPPEYSAQSLVVGKGYDILHDRLLRTTPFLRNPLKRPSSSLGYQFPDFVECEKLPAADEVILANATQSKDDYYQERLKYLTLPDKEHVVISEMKGETKPYLNLKPAVNGEISALKEIRLLECKMTIENDSVAIVDERFTTVVNALPRLNTSCSCSMTQWRLFLQSYGTHIVTKSFGGGCYEGTVLLSGKDALADSLNIEGSLNDIINFKNLEDSAPTDNNGRAQVYQFHVGGGSEVDPLLNQLHQLTKAEQETLLKEWKKQLNAEFEMLTNEIELVPISQLLKAMNAEKGADCEEATNLLYQGKLGGGPSITQITTVDPAVMRERVRKQAANLRKTNSEKAAEKIKKFNEFVDGVAASS